MSFSLAPHPIGLKFWKNLWHTNKDLNGAQLSAKLTDSAYHITHRRLGKYFFLHRAGPLGMKASVVVLFLGVKIISGIYGTRREEIGIVLFSLVYILSSANKVVNVAYGEPISPASRH